MIIKQVHIDGFGKWHDQDFTFQDNPQLIYGPNEAGKTTLTKFILSILFGFTDGRGKNRYAQYIPKDTSSYGGSIVVEQAGKIYRIRRQRGKNGGKVTVIFEDGRQGGEEALQNLLGTMDRQLYQALFSFGQRDLAMVDEVDKAHWQQHLQQVGAVGSRRWSALVNELTQQADQLYKPRGRKWPLNRDLHHYQQLTTKIDQARGKYDEYQQLKQKLAQAAKSQHEDQQQLANKQDRLTALARLERLWPVYAKWQNGRNDQLRGTKWLTDSQVLSAQDLQARERAVHQQRVAYQQQLTSLTSGDDHLISSRQDDLGQLMGLKRQVIQLQAREEYQQTSERQLEKWQAERQKLQAAYQGRTLPAPLSLSDRQQLEKILQARTSAGFELSHSQMGAVIAGVLLFIIGILVNNNFLTVVGTIVMFLTFMLVYQQKGKQQTSDHDKQLRSFGIAHDLQPFPVDQWLSMQADLRQDAQLREQISQVTTTQRQFDEQVGSLRRRLPATITARTLHAIADQLDELIRHRQTQLQKRQTVDHEKDSVQQHLAQLIADENQLEKQKMALYALAGVQSDQDFNHYLERRAHNQAVVMSTTAYGDQLAPADKDALDKYADHDQLVEEVAASRKKVDRLNGQLIANQQRMQELRVKIASLVADGSLSELEQERANLEAKIWQEVQEWLSYQLAIEWINKALVRASADRYPTIIKQAEKYFDILTAHRYRKINLIDNGVQVVASDQEVFAADELSQGTAEQLYVALRLGFVSVMRDQANFPVIIDDGFVNFDNQRRQRMMILLKEIAKNNQVLYFTADDRIKRQGQRVLDLTKLNIE